MSTKMKKFVIKKVTEIFEQWIDWARERERSGFVGVQGRHPAASCPQPAHGWICYRI
jgi:hypothetical protein